MYVTCPYYSLSKPSINDTGAYTTNSTSSSFTALSSISYNSGVRQRSFYQISTSSDYTIRRTDWTGSSSYQYGYYDISADDYAKSGKILHKFNIKGIEGTNSSGNASRITYYVYHGVYRIAETITDGKGIASGYVTSTSSSAYPDDDISGSYWYTKR